MKKKKILKKKLEDFIKDESGEISRDKVLKIGLGTISALGIMASFASNLSAGHTSGPTHVNNIVTPPGAGSNVGKADCALGHSSHSSHGSHNSY